MGNKQTEFLMRQPCIYELIESHMWNDKILVQRDKTFLRRTNFHPYVSQISSF